MRWARVFLVLMMVVDVWYRAHTFAPDVRAATGIDLWPQTIGESEPLDCDEAAYAYMGRRILRGDALYRDLTEYKPPLGYWIYTAAVASGGYDELAIRLMAIPFVLATIAAVWWIGLRLGGPVAACVASALYVLLSTDPFLFANGSNLEHFINLFSILSLALMLRGWDHGRRGWFLGAGVSLGAAALVKQVALAHALLYLPALLLRGGSSRPPGPGRVRKRSLDALAFGIGLAAVVAVAVAIILSQGARRAAYEDIILQARALATDTLPDPLAPSPAIRWLTGNADPRGHLPWPFGSTDYLVWWGTGSWPLWLASVPALIALLAGPGRNAPRRLAAGWTLAAWVEVALPGLYWQHYYMLPIPGVAIVVAVSLADAIGQMSLSLGLKKARADDERDDDLPPKPDRRRHPVLAAGVAAILIVAAAATAALQARYYLGVTPQELTSLYKGGRQWVALRELGRDVARRAVIWDDPRVYVWGWQSPLNFYSRIDSPSRHFFVDNLLRDQAGRDHPLIGPRVAEIMATLRARPPELIFTGYPPFPALRAFLSEGYLLSPRVPGLWIRRGDFGRFEVSGPHMRARGSAARRLAGQSRPA